MFARHPLVVLTLLTLACSLSSSYLRLEEGESCVTHNKRPGVCTRIGRCPGAITAVRRRQLKAKVCSYNKHLVICCKETVQTSAQMLSVGPPPPQQEPDKNSYRIAEEMCKKYGEHSFMQRELETLLPQRQFVRVLVCEAHGQELIVGGTEAISGEFPHMAALGYPAEEDDMKIEWKCGGTLISERFVLTAAHCKHFEMRKVAYVLLGALNVKGRTPTDKIDPVTMRVETFIRHEGYKRGHKYDDIALIKLTEPAPLGPYIRPACLQTDPSEHTKHKYLTALGWGYTNPHTRTVSETLMKVNLQLTPQGQCQEMYSSLVFLSRGIDTSIMLCAGDPKGEKDTCMGDSGGPIQVFRNAGDCTFSVVGVTSFGHTDCVSNIKPGVYTRVYHYIPWIQRHVWP